MMVGNSNLVVVYSFKVYYYRIRTGEQVMNKLCARAWFERYEQTAKAGNILRDGDEEAESKDRLQFNEIRNGYKKLYSQCRSLT